MTFPFLSFFFVYFSTRINYRDALPSQHTKRQPEKNFKKCFWRAFSFGRNIVTSRRADGGGEVWGCRKQNKCVGCVCAVENLCQVKQTA